MKYEILGDSYSPILECTLGPRETMNLERGSMAYMFNVELEGKLNKGKGLGGVLKSVTRSYTSGESMFITRATASSYGGVIGIAPSSPGKIVSLDVDNSHQYRLNTGAYLASSSSVGYNMKMQSVKRAMFGGTGGFFVMETYGSGHLFLASFGDVVALHVSPKAPIIVDNDHVLAWDSSLSYNIKIASGFFGFASGEGLVNEFHGEGTVLVQSRNMASFVGNMVPFLTPYFSK